MDSRFRGNDILVRTGIPMPNLHPAFCPERLLHRRDLFIEQPALILIFSRQVLRFFSADMHRRLPEGEGVQVLQVAEVVLEPRELGLEFVDRHIFKFIWHKITP